MDRVIFEYEYQKAYDHLEIEFGINQHQLTKVYEKYDLNNDANFMKLMENKRVEIVKRQENKINEMEQQ